MAKTPDELMSLRFGEATVADNLKRAIASGKLIERVDGSLEIAGGPDDNRKYWMTVMNGPPLGCGFLMQVMFEGAYARSAVPHGCSACYKVKIAPRTLRQLVAAWQIGKQTGCLSKWGIDLYDRYSQNVYAGYFYTAGLDAARALFKVVREAVDADPKLGPDVSMIIKRGCSEYEAAIGPSDRYAFTPEMAELETYLKSKFRAKQNPKLLNVPLAYWIDIAFRMGDDTYLDFTGGRRLRPKMMTYDPTPVERAD